MWMNKGFLSLAYSSYSHRPSISYAGSPVDLWDMLSEEPDVRLEGQYRSVAGISIAYSLCGYGRYLAAMITLYASGGGVFSQGEVLVLGLCDSRGFWGYIDALTWNPVEPLEFPTGCKDYSIRLWSISEGGKDNVSVGLVLVLIMADCVDQIAHRCYWIESRLPRVTPPAWGC